MKIFIDKLFFQHLVQSRNELFSSNSTNTEEKLKTILNIKDFLMSYINKYIDSDWNEEIKKHIDSMQGERNYKSYEEIIIHKAIMDNKLRIFDKNMIDLEVNPNAYYLLESDCFNISKNKGVIRKDVNFDFKDFYRNADVSHKLISGGDYFPISELKFPCSSLIYIDKYLFNGDRGSLTQKLSRFIEFAKSFNIGIKIPFQITILTSNEENSKTISNNILEFCFEYITTKLIGYHIQIFVEKRFFRLTNQNNHDRLFYTNYSMGNIGNPFSPNPTVFNQNFLTAGKDISDINNRLNAYRNETDNLKRTIDRYQDSTLIYSNEKFENRIFES